MDITTIILATYETILSVVFGLLTIFLVTKTLNKILLKTDSDNETKYAGIVDSRSYKEYVDEKSRDGTWGDNKTLQVFANIRNVKIELYTDYEDERIIEIFPSGKELESLPTIRLSSYSEWHYNSVRDVPERTPSPQPSVSMSFEDLTSPHPCISRPR